MPRWIEVARASDCPPGGSWEVVAEGQLLALFNVDGSFFALDGVCPHQGGPLGKGVLAGCVVTCPWHGWQFDVTSGQHQFAPTVRQPCYAARVEEGRVLVDMDRTSGAER
jgi:nitrite reductase/ring-hydroxylating ferredoxin subunit